MIIAAAILVTCVFAVLVYDVHKQPKDDGRPQFSVRKARVPTWLPEND